MKRDVYDQTKYIKVKKLFRDGNYRAALKQIDEYLFEFPHDYTARVFKARILFSLGEYEEVRKKMEGIVDFIDIEDAPKPKRYCYEVLLDVAVVKGDIDEIKRICNIGLNLFPGDGYKFRIALSNIYLSNNDYNKALAILKTDNFNNYDLNIARSKVYLKKNDILSALKALDQEVYSNEGIDSNKYNRSKDYIFHLKSILLHRLGRNEDALECALKAIKNTSSSRKTYYDMCLNIANLYFITYNISNAIQILKSVINHCSDKEAVCSAYASMQYMYIRSGNYKAIEDLKMQCDDEYTRCMLDIQQLYSEYKFEEALEIINSLKPDIQTMYYKLLILYRLGKKDEFMALYEEYKKMPDYDPYKTSSFDIKKAERYFSGDIIIDEKSSYLDRQFVDYSRDVAINQIVIRHVDNLNNVNENAIKYDFSSDTDVNKLYDEVQSKLDSSYKICDDTDDKYFVPVDDVKNKNGEQVKYVAVVCFADTKNIITIYPYYYYEPEVKINIDKTKNKRLSNMDKFKNKFGNM